MRDGAPASALMRVRGLRVDVPDHARKPLFGRAPRLEILHGIDLDIAEGAAVGLVGESGSGKTTLGRTLVRLTAPSAGEIAFLGRDIARLPERSLRPLRRDLQIIFQDPMSSLNPRKTVGEIVAGPLRLHGDPREATGRAVQALVRVGLPADFAARYPHQLSGGQRQRVGVARAVALEPRFVVADEIVSGLDVSSQANVLALLERLRAELGLTLVFISHDLSVVRRLCDHVVVLRAGEIVEQGPTARVFAAPRAAYTRTLLDAIPTPVVDPGWLAR